MSNLETNELGVIIEALEAKYQPKLDEFSLDEDCLYASGKSDHPEESYDGHDPRIAYISIELSDCFHNFLMEEGVVTEAAKEKLGLLVTAIYDGVWDMEVAALLPGLTRKMNMPKLGQYTEAY